MPTILEFEKPVFELIEKLKQLKEFSETHGVEVKDGVQALEKSIEETRRKIYTSLTPWQRVLLARHPERPYPRDYIKTIFTDFMELRGDRRYSEDAAIIGGFAKLDNQNVMIIGTQKGRNLKENVLYNFGSAHPEGYRKALRLMKMADKANVPIITLIDTPGAYPGIGAEERHVGEAIAVNLREMFKIKVPVICVITGEGGSGGALGIGIGNTVMIMENAYYSVITPEGCAAILWHNAAKASDAAKALKITSGDLSKLGIVDEVVKEPMGAAHSDPETAAELLKKAIKARLQELGKENPDGLRLQRYERFRKLGVFKAE